MEEGILKVKLYLEGIRAYKESSTKPVSHGLNWCLQLAKSNINHFSTNPKTGLILRCHKSHYEWLFSLSFFVFPDQVEYDK